MLTINWFWKLCCVIIIYMISWDVVVSCSRRILSGECEQGWFGSSCQYRCRCESYQCTVNGACQPGYKCQGGWFGPECQYMDLAYNTSRLYTDGNDRTCIMDDTDYIKVPLNNSFPAYRFTWLRIVLLQPWTEILLRRLFIEFKIRNETLGCINARNSTVNKQTLDVHCDVPDEVQSLVLKSSAVYYFCSVYVSGGRSVALGQNASSTHIVMTSPNWAVDADTSIRSSACARMTYQNSTTWTLTLQTPVHVDRFILYESSYNTYNITVDYFTQESTKVFSYTYTRDYFDNTRDYRVLVSTYVKSPVSYVVVEWENKWPGRYYYIFHCEFEMFGDSYCPKQSYGRECEHRCNCKNDSECFGSTGSCPAGCAEGYQGESCSEFQNERILPTEEETTCPTCTVPFVVIGFTTVVVILLIIALVYLRWRGKVKGVNTMLNYSMEYFETHTNNCQLTEPETSLNVQVSNTQQPEKIGSNNQRENAAGLSDSTNVYEIITDNIYSNVSAQ